MSVPSVLLISQDRSFEEYATALRSEKINCQVAGSYAEVVSFLERLTSGGDIEEVTQCIAVVDGDIPQDMAFQVFKLLHSAHAVPTLTLVAPERYQQFALDSHRPPLDEYAAKPVGVGELILRVKAMMIRSGYEIPDGSLGYVVGRSEGIHHGTIIVLFSPKGGVGKSTIAVNLAVGLSRFYDYKTLLVDADLWFGDVGVLLNLASRKSVFDISAEEDTNLGVLQQVLVQHSSGTHLLLRPPDLSTAEKIRSDIVVSAISSYRALFDYVIVDTHPTLDELNLQILDVADRIIMITTPEISAVHHTSRFLEVSGALGISNKLSLVLNRANSGIRLAALEEQLGMPIAGTVVSAGRAVVEAANHGVSLFDQDPNEEAEVTRDLARLVELVAGQPRPERQNGEAAPVVAAAKAQSREARPFWKRSAK
ncbi:MAG TPA: AAA family ATPase [Chloroflexota bacterium]|nr:AAA family ATPase [Chloroflexota bacterium]